MGAKSKVALRTVDVARRSGYSVQQIRLLEDSGVLPPADRTPGGHRVYRDEHVHAALAYRGLAAGMGPVEAKKVLRAVNANARSQALALLDAAHADLHRQRQQLAMAKQAAEAITLEPIADVRASDAMTISELADALGIRTSTLRHWDAEGLVVPDRDPHTRTRRYTPAQVRDARIVHQLRQAGYPIPMLAEVMPHLRHPHGLQEVRRMLAARDERLDARSQALCEGTAELQRTVIP
ncbi:MerR family transcriptional regulator [Thermocrispum municipale]|uniref:MerR family transcriptional regulator n=1 Tax=Thermocrispum municipale TaxID=37926 RepID=UPI000419E8EC|nr:MerR family transcriptional regulator [Thermocrispum municipale]